MTIPANLGAENNWGSAPATVCWGPQGGPYNPANTGQGLPVQGSEAAGQSGSSVNPVLTGRLDGNGNVQANSGNQDLTLLTSATRTSTTNSADQVNRNGRGVIVYLNVTAASGTGGIQLIVYAKDPVSGVYRGMNLGPTAVTATGFYYYVLYPGASGGAPTQTTGQLVPTTWRVGVYHNDASNYTYSVGASLIL